MSRILDFRLNEKSDVEIKVRNPANGEERWVKLVTFTEDCPYGRYGYLDKDVVKGFNPYSFFDQEDEKKIENYLNR